MCDTDTLWEHESSNLRPCTHKSLYKAQRGNKAKLTFQMIKLKHYHHVSHFFCLFVLFLPPAHNNWFGSSELARVKPIYDFSSELPVLKGGQAGRCPSGAGQESALLRLNAHWWLLWWCGGSHGGVVINISPGLIPLVHKQRLELLWELSTKVRGPSEGSWARQPLCHLGVCPGPAAGVTPEEDGRAANKRTVEENRGMKPKVGTGRDDGRDMRTGAQERRGTALFQIDWEILLHCLK